MKKFILALLFAVTLTSTAMAQAPASVTVRSAEIGDSTRITITWPIIAGRTTYDVLTHSVPRRALFEQFRVVTGGSWSITVPRSTMEDSMRIVAHVRSSSPTSYASITYRTPKPTWTITFKIDTTGTN